MKRVEFPTSSIEQKTIRYLSIGKERYTIPEYQRPYSWTVKEVRELINDIESNFKLGIPLQLGNIVLITKDRHEFFVIDGQQRLTTMFKLIELLQSRVTKYPVLKEKMVEVYMDTGYRNDDPHFPRITREVGDIEIPQEIIDELEYNIDTWISEYGNDTWQDQGEIVDYIMGSTFLTQTFYAVINNFQSSYRLIVDYFHKMNTRGLKFDESEINRVSEYLNKLSIEE